MKLRRILELVGRRRRCSRVCPGRPLLGDDRDCLKPLHHDGACDFGLQDSDERSETPIT